MRAKHIVFVHGLFGWGHGAVAEVPYWGEAISSLRDQLDKKDRSDITTHEASCGPVSSFHDRACEIFAQLMREKVDYGAEHAATEHHEQFGSDQTGKLAPQWPADEPWSEENPVIFIAHSAGAHTCLQLQQLLADDYWKRGTNARWVEAVICISGVLNGSTLTYNLGCDKSSGLLTGPIGDFIGSGIQLLGGLTRGQARNFYDWGLDQWIVPTDVSGVVELIAKLKASHFAKGRDNLAYDMTLKGSQEANRRFKTQDHCYYLSIVTEQTSSIFFSYHQTPTPVLMNPVLWSSSLYQGSSRLEAFLSRPRFWTRRRRILEFPLPERLPSWP